MHSSIATSKASSKRPWLVRTAVKQALAGCALAAALVPGAVLAADAEDQGQPQMQEVTVTATRHEESISKVPISVSAYTQDSMDQMGIRDFTDIARYTPGVYRAMSVKSRIPF